MKAATEKMWKQIQKRKKQQKERFDYVGTRGNRRIRLEGIDLKHTRSVTAREKTENETTKKYRGTVRGEKSAERYRKSRVAYEFENQENNKITKYGPVVGTVRCSTG